tara:strand:+ start:2759 stop:3469 length:711 start_codon:yes stop_codon:yes gene_type:complete
MVLVLLAASLAGCVSGEPPVLEVTVSETDTAVVETYQNGVLVERAGATVFLDFSGSTSAVTYTVAVSDGRATIEASADEGGMLNLTFDEHGVYNITATAVDAKGRTTSQSLVVRVNLRIEWNEEATQDPASLSFDPLPMHGGPMADYITIESVVSNPELIENLGGGREVDITWQLIDPLGGACQQHTDVVHEGASAAWNTLHFNTYEAHELAVQYDEGQDELDVLHTVIVVYEAPA